MSRVSRDESQRMRELRAEVDRFTSVDTASNTTASAIQGLSFLRSQPAKLPMQCMIKPALCVTVQGRKYATFGDKRYDYASGQALVVTIDMPSNGTAFAASRTEPYLGVVCELDLPTLQAVADEFETGSKPRSGQKSTGAFVLDLTEQLEDCILRAVRLLENPRAIQALYPSIMRELCFWLLSSPSGAQALLFTGGQNRRLMDAIHLLRDRFREALRVEDLARAAHMSPTAFFRHFKAVTSMAPLQYQKQLRLLEARRLMMFGDANVETAAYDVGYASPSQFSREYARAFGNPPRRDVASLRVAHA